MGRMRRGWELTQESWAVVRRDRSLLVFPVVAGVCCLVVAVIVFGAGAGLAAAADAWWPAVPFLIAGAYLLIVIGQFCAVALASCATAALDGRDTTVREGVDAARGRLGVILQWAAVQLVVGAAISALQSLLREAGGGIVGAIVGGLADLAWTVATFFVVPVIALEGLGPKDAIKRSSGVVRERWGEGVVGSAAIGLVAFLIALPGIALVVGGVAAVSASPAGGGALIALGVLLIIAAGLFQATISAVFRVALFRFATQNEVTGGFTREQLAGAFAPKRGARA